MMELYRGTSKQAQYYNKRGSKIVSTELNFLDVALLKLKAAEMGVSMSKAAGMILRDVLKVS
jgi:hypothetical protein